MPTVLKQRWFWFFVASGAFDGLGYQDTGGLLLGYACGAAALWFWGFDRARNDRANLFADVLSPANERWILFAAALIGLLLASSSSTMVERAGAVTVSLVIARSIVRQGYRIGSRQLSAAEYMDELKYGALGKLATALFAFAVSVIAAETAGVIILVLMVTPIGLIAISDEPLYLRRDDYVRRYFRREYRRRELGRVEELW